ncbi:iron-siderophore ABC transporter substrate-binding protein [Actinobacteria bacterium YIM 96077]|uniref:Fe/B12 periplasmic-binding domain-containing protein n=1 Tax=Phytoactinopolyspora halophila TaxID=1981511 RepID=A0A329R0M5_9ACTN|nr:iron-siderophore ABC transporter substrate-binding protein [Phytoactinopolyspora halophila]AYY13212.1 iron-siderophore ABC transporter substrate-binding protein [Actinobacteria bacterium YIM 96077]RAW17549.1 hypothetical protein DPM12_06035 [Phytoactinopolyspora halophila]
MMIRPSITTVRPAVAAISAGLLLVACSGSDDGTSDATDADAPDAGDRTIEHELGETEVPGDPERVVALDPYASLPTALEAGATVVGTSYQPFGEPFPEYVDAELAGEAEDVGWFTDLNVERIAALEPDVIVGLVSFIEPYEEDLSEIAPTIALPLDDMVWKDTLETVGRAIGRSDEVADRLQEYEHEASELEEELADAGVASEPVSLLNIRALDDLRVYTRSCAAAVLTDVGLEMHLSDETEDGDNAVRLSIERLTDADAAHLFYFVGSTGTNPDDAEATHDQVSNHPLWTEMDAVRSGNAYAVDTGWWFNCGSVPAAERILDDTGSALLDGTVPES